MFTRPDERFSWVLSVEVALQSSGEIGGHEGRGEGNHFAVQVLFVEKFGTGFDELVDCLLSAKLGKDGGERVHYMSATVSNPPCWMKMV